MKQRQPTTPSLPAILPTTRRHQTLFVLGLLSGGLLALALTQPLLNALAPSPVTADTNTAALLQPIGNATLDWTRSHLTLPATGNSSAALRQLRVDSDSTLADWMRQYPPLATRLDQLTAQRDPASPLALHGRNGIGTLLLAFKLHHSRPGHANADHSNPSTTLIIDARGLPLQAALFPRLTNAQGQPLFTLQDTDPNQVAAHGLAVYTRSTQAARSHLPAGQASLILTALGLAPRSTTDLALPPTSLPDAIALPIIIITDQ